MCGIFGRFERSGAGHDLETLCEATNLLTHRGPDEGSWWSDGPYFFGHRRLSIIDVAGGHQPMCSADGRLVIVFNGEIYNYVELREELRLLGAEFRTESDTEVLLAGYSAWGVSLPNRLIGMFAFAIADRAEQTLFLARDRFGEKPLFLIETARSITFASELSALRRLPDTSSAIDDEALGAYLCLNYVPLDRTMLRDVRRLPAGTWRRYSTRSVITGNYRVPAPTLSMKMSMSDGIDRFRVLLDDSVKMALRSDVPVTLFLSGGVDSSLIAESAVRQGHLATAYCLDFPVEGYSEIGNASTVAGFLGIELRRISLTSDALTDFLDIVGHADDPLADSSALAVWTLAKAVARDYKVAISGDGGDELFGGYLTYKATKYHRHVISRLPSGVRRFLARSSAVVPVTAGKVSTSYQVMRFLRAADLPSAEAHMTWNGTWLPEQAARLAKPSASTAARESLQRIISTHGLEPNADTQALQRMDAEEYLCNDILVKVDRMTMAHGLEARAPLLTPALANFAFALPEDLKLTLVGRPKRLLREMVRRIYGERLASARKQGFSIPIHTWLRGPARPLAESLLSAKAVSATGLLDEREVSAAWSAHQSGRAQLGFELWGLMVLVAWHQARVTSRPGAGASGLRRTVVPSLATATWGPKS